MAITLGSLTLPQGLIWTDEFAWNSLGMLTEYSLTGALVVDIATKQTGRPITLVGGPNFTWISRADIATLQGILNSCTSAGVLLTLHDGSTHTVIPSLASGGSSGAGALIVKQIPSVLDTGVANPTTTTWYSLELLTLISI